jgi:hypothetical protein
MDAEAAVAPAEPALASPRGRKGLPVLRWDGAARVGSPSYNRERERNMVRGAMVLLAALMLSACGSKEPPVAGDMTTANVCQTGGYLTGSRWGLDSGPSIRPATFGPRVAGMWRSNPAMFRRWSRRCACGTGLRWGDARSRRRRARR